MAEDTPRPDAHRARPSGSRIERVAWAGVGFLFVGIAAVGVVVPGLPTTPFLLVAAACFVRSSQRLYDWLLSHRTFGPLIRDYREGRGIPLRAKRVAVLTMSVFVAFAVLVGIPEDLPGVKIAVALAGAYGAFFVLRLPTKVERDGE